MRLRLRDTSRGESRSPFHTTTIGISAMADRLGPGLEIVSKERRTRSLAL